MSQKHYLIFKKGEKELFLLFYKKFEQGINSFRNIYINNTNEEIVLEFEFVGKEKGLSIKKLKLWLAESVVVYYKTKYFEDNLKLPSLTEVSFKTICKTLAVFDKLTDVEFALSKLNITNQFIPESYYAFCLRDLRARWQEVCKLFYKNLPELIASDAFLDLVRYLLSETEPATNNIFIAYQKSGITVKDEKGLDLIEPIDFAGDYIGKLVLEIITLSPKQIFIYKKNELETAAESLRQLFSDKVVYCTWQIFFWGSILISTRLS